MRFRSAYRSEGQRPVCLVLGGGSAKGLAHIGVLEVLEEEGLGVDAIAGTSAGALMGSFRAAGFTGAGLRWAFRQTDFGAEIFDSRRRTASLTLGEEEARHATVFRLDSRPGGWEFLPGEATGQAASRVLMAHLMRADALSGGDFANLGIPFGCVASNLTQGRLEWVTRGDLVQAVQASMSIPGVFRPVQARGDQLVDGGLSQNLPVLEARRWRPAAVQLAVDVSDPWEVRAAANPFSLVGRSLSFSVEVMTRLNREAADVLVQPDVQGADIFDFHGQVDLLAERGRRAMLAQLPALERHLYGAEGARPLGPDRWILIGDATEEVRAVAEACFQPGRTWCRQDAYRFLRRVLARGLAAEAWITLPDQPDGPMGIHVQAPPALRSVTLAAPPEWMERLGQLARSQGLVAGKPCGEPALAAFKEQVLMEASLRGHPLVEVQGSSLSPLGDLHLEVRPILVTGVEVETAQLRPESRQAMQRLVSPMLGGPLDTRRLARTLAELEQPLNLQNPRLRLRATPDQGDWILSAHASDQSRVQINVAAAYESTWGLHGVLDAWLRDLGAKGLELGFHAYGDRIQVGAEVRPQFAAPSDPSMGLFLTVGRRRHRFEGDPLLGYFGSAPDPAGYQALIERSRLQIEEASIGLFKRFSLDRRGLAQLEVQRRDSTLEPVLYPRIANRATAGVASLEWDSLNRHTFPTEGLLLRTRVMAGRTDIRVSGSPVTLQEQIRTAYLHLRAIKAGVLGPVGADLALEAGLGWRTLLTPDRQFILGGDFSLIGTPSTRFLAPNFAILRAGLPIPLRQAFGGHIQLIPRLDIGRFSQDSTGLTSGMRVLGQGLMVQGAVGKFFIETGWGQVQIRPAGPGPLRRENQLNILLGARPFDLWTRR